MPVIFLHPVFHGFVYCIVKQKKNLMNIDALVPIQTKLKLRHYNLWKV